MTARREPEPAGGGDRSIEDFWRWWADAGRAGAEAGIAGAGFDRFAGEMTRRVRAVHPDLAWELAPGRRARHALVVTAGGRPEPRRAAERWYLRAPATGPHWEYHPARQANPSSLESVLEVGGRKLSLAELVFDLTVDQGRQRVDTTVFHPAFPGLPARAKAEVGFLALDWALGEDGVTRWIGRFAAADKPPAVGIPASGLVEVVAGLAGRVGEPRWVLRHGQHDGAPVFATVAVPAKWIDHPLLDQHLTVALPFADQTPDGLPGPLALDQLRALEDQLTDQLAARAVLVAHETSRGTRTLHLYADSDDTGIARQARDLVSGWPGAAVSWQRDAGWRAVRHLTG